MVLKQKLAIAKDVDIDLIWEISIAVIVGWKELYEKLLNYFNVDKKLFWFNFEGKKFKISQKTFK